ADSGKVYVAKNGTWQNSGNPALGTGYIGIVQGGTPGLASYYGKTYVNFGQGGVAGVAYNGTSGGSYKYAPPSGYLALSTANAATPGITLPNRYFDAQPYTGNNSLQNIVLNFQPDLVWIKNRGAAYNNTVDDSARGPNFNLFSNTSGAQVQNDNNGSVTAFSSNGFTVGGSCAAPTGDVNAAGNSYAAWAWKKSAAAGIDVESYTGGSTSGTPVTIYLTSTSATAWIVPSDWNSFNNSIEVIGGGGGGGNGNVAGGGSGGGGGAYSKQANVILTPGSTVTVAIGAGGSPASAGGDTYLCNSTSNCASLAGTAVIVGAQGGAGGVSNQDGGGGGTGGVSASGIGSIKTSGGNGGSTRGGGGGGAAGPTSNGARGGNGSNQGATSGAPGGGGADGGSQGTDWVSGSSGLAGGAGANGGGAGGAGGAGGNPGFAGTTGAAGTEWDATHGSGGGAGGGGSCQSSGCAGTGGTGGGYGGGGGGSGYDNAGGTSSGGPGAQGVIVIKYTPSTSSGYAHTLTTKPDFIVNKRIDQTGDWYTWFSALGTNSFLKLNTTDAALSGSLFSVSNSTVTTQGPLNTTGAQYVSYLFSNREGFSKAGTYIANGASDGPFVYTGFKPAFVMVKDISSSNTYTNWTIYDTSRDTQNPAYRGLFANLGVAENGDASCTNNSNCSVDLFANGFKMRSHNYENNNSTDTYAYIAFAGIPFKSASTPAALTIPYSMHFDGSQTPYLSRSFGALGSNTTATLSMWVKRGQLGTYQYLYAANSAQTDSGFFSVSFSPGDQLRILGWNSSWRITNQIFRDPSHWYHIVVAVDTTQPDSAANNRIRVYVDGSEITSFATLNNPAQNASLGLDAIGPHYISTYDGATSPFDGYLADVYWIDGQQLAPASFGAYDGNGFWKPGTYSGPVGTDGFHLNFSSVSNTDFNQGPPNILVGPLYNTTTYTLTCNTAAEGVPVSTQATVTVTGAVLSLTACNAANTSCSSGVTPAFVKSGDRASLYWSATGAVANSCNVTAPDSSIVAPASTNNVPQSAPSQTQPITGAGNTTYTLSCMVNGSPQSTTASVTTSQSCQTGVGTAPVSCSSQCALYTSASSVTPGTQATVSWCCPSGPTSGVNFSTDGAAAGSVSVGAGTYQLSCPAGSGSIVIGSTPAGTKPSSIILTASPSRVSSGQASKLFWTIVGMVPGISCNTTPGLTFGMPAWNGLNPWYGSAPTGLIFGPTTYTLSCGDGTATTSASVNLGLVPNFKEI
ncbi:MAG: hypothetical protein KGI70_01300, partial [Patescibacteria group bacterium]|nr:hypothetical protein [Patescibacteria group bacterium]